MKYIVEVDESQEGRLAAAIRELNPQAAAPVPVAEDGEHRTARLSEARKFYEADIRESLPSLPRWEDLPGETKEAVAADLAGYIGWQFEGFTFDYTTPDWLREMASHG